MSLYQRYRRWRGYDTTREIVHEEARYRYEVTHLNGEVSTDEGNRHTRDDGFLLILEADDETWAKITFDPYHDVTGKPGFSGRRGYDTVRELEGVQEVEREQIGIDRWRFTVDMADLSWLDTEREYEEL